MILFPSQTLEAGVDSQCERTGEALIQALRDPTSQTRFDADVDLELLDDCHNVNNVNEEARRGLRFSWWWDTGYCQE